MRTKVIVQTRVEPQLAKALKDKALESGISMYAYIEAALNREILSHRREKEEEEDIWKTST